MPADSLPPPEDKQARASLVDTLLVLNTSVNLLVAKMDSARSPLPRLQLGNLVLVVALSAVIATTMSWVAMPKPVAAVDCREARR
jgi:hypothetical protein